ncbi:MAG: hypothetical protein FWE69_07460 [Clostridiales bacterium]|nr:hypothetical protein [Clostridiales bacterium]
MPNSVAITIGAVLALVGTIIAYVLIIPEKRKAGLNKFLLFLHDTFTFKKLLLETVLRAMYVFSTIFCVCAGFFLLFAGTRFYGYNWYGSGSSFQSSALSGLALMGLGPVVVRLTYEGLMLFILLVKNTIEINKKMSSSDE